VCASSGRSSLLFFDAKPDYFLTHQPAFLDQMTKFVKGSLIRTLIRTKTMLVQTHNLTPQRSFLVEITQLYARKFVKSCLCPFSFLCLFFAYVVDARSVRRGGGVTLVLQLSRVLTA
jgi:hypothetical protein